MHGTTLKNLRIQAGFRQTELARAARVSVSCLKIVENDNRKTQPSKVVLYRIANALGLGIDAFTSDEVEAA